MTINYCNSSQFETRLYLGDKLLEQVKEATLLGVILTDDLKWHRNTQNLVQRAYKRMSILRNLVAFNVPKYDLVIIYTLYIRSIIEQSCVVWGPSLTESDAAALERVQKCSLRIIYDTEYISYNHALAKSGLSDLSSRRVKLLQILQTNVFRMKLHISCSH